LYNNIDKSKVLLGQHVSEIRYAPEGMEVISDGNKLRSSRVVTTIPPQLLASDIQFSPPLHQDVMDIMKNTHTWMGNSVKGSVTYKVPFWKERGLSGALYSNPGPFAQMYDQSNENGAALVGFLNAKISQLPFEERKKKVIEQLLRVFGEEAKYCLDYRDTIWSEEHFTMHRHAPRLSRHHNNGHEIYEKPFMDGRLVIGGSETSSQGGGYMEGAVHSAITVAIMLTNK
jgi:monoamine oxidase